jgi:hypothetical protein
VRQRVDLCGDSLCRVGSSVEFSESTGRRFTYGFCRDKSAGTPDPMFRPAVNARQGREPLTNLLIDWMEIPDLVADCLMAQIVVLVQNHLDTMQPAGESLARYRAGSGADKWYDANKMLKDSGFRAYVTEVDRSGKPTMLTIGTEAWATREWQYTFGSVDFTQVTLLDGSDPARAKVRIVIVDPYQWHPDEPRISRFAHGALENMKMAGAKEYLQRVDQVVEIDMGK